MSIANLTAGQRLPGTHPVTSGVILLGLIVLIRPPLVHAVTYVFMNTILYVIWYQIFTVSQWDTNQLLVRILELIIVAVTSLVALAATERFTRKVFISQLQVKRAVKAVTAEEERSMLLLQNVFPAAIVFDVREVKRPLCDYSCTFHDASMLNSDIVGFTKFSSTKEPHVVVEMLNRMFTKFDAHAAVLGLEKIKTIGDAYLCASGVPVPDQYHHRKIISMGRKMVHSMFEMNKEGLPSLPNLDLHIRVGAATGPIRAGVVGLQKACFDVFGEVSEDSEHMESSGRPDRVQVTEELYEAAKDLFQFEQLENKDGHMGYFVIDDGIEPFMGLKSQVEEQNKNFKDQHPEFADIPLASTPDVPANGSDNDASGRNSRAASNASNSRRQSLSAAAIESATKVNVKRNATAPRTGTRQSFHTHFGYAEDGSPLESNSQLLSDKPDNNGDSDDDEALNRTVNSTTVDNSNGGTNNNNNLRNELAAMVDGDAVRIMPSRPKPLTNNEHMEDLYKFLEDTNMERQDLVKAYADFDGEKSIFDLSFKFDRAEEEFRMYYQKLAESRIMIETVQGFLLFAICALLVGLHLGQVANWFVIAQMVVAGLHIILVIVFVILKRIQKAEQEDARRKKVFNFENEDGYNTALGDAGALSTTIWKEDSNLDVSPSGLKKAQRQQKKKTQQQQQQKIGSSSAFPREDSSLKEGGGGLSASPSRGGFTSFENAQSTTMAVDDGLTQEDLLESDSDEEEVDPSSPQFNITRVRNDASIEELSICTYIRLIAFVSGMLSFSMPIVLVVAVDDDEIEIIMVFVMLASVVYITSFLHLRFIIKVAALLLHFIGITAAFFIRVVVQRVDGLSATTDGGNYLAVVCCYACCIIAGYSTESNVRSAFAVAKKVVFQNAELLSAIDLCDKLLKNVLPASIVRRMIADPTKAIVDEVDEASVLFLYVDGVRPHTEAEAEGKETGRMVNDMNEFLFIMDCLCMYHHVEKIKTVPYLVVSGCPEPISRHCNRLAALARDVIHFAEAYNRAYHTSIRVKAGLHSGKVTAGVLGATKFIYDVFGDTVNFASRLASSSTWGVVQCSDHARKLMEGFTEVIDRGEIELKGKGMQKVYTVDLDSIDLKKAPIVVHMTPAAEVDVNSFKEFDPHMKVFAANAHSSLGGAARVDSSMGERRTSIVASPSANVATSENENENTKQQKQQSKDVKDVKKSSDKKNKKEQQQQQQAPPVSTQNPLTYKK